MPGPCTHTISCESQNNPVTEVLFVILMSQTRKLRQRKVKGLIPVSQGSRSEYVPELGFEVKLTPEPIPFPIRFYCLSKSFFFL